MRCVYLGAYSPSTELLFLLLVVSCKFTHPFPCIVLEIKKEEGKHSDIIVLLLALLIFTFQFVLYPLGFHLFTVPGRIY